MNPEEKIKEIFRNTKTIAVVGFSSNEEKAGYYVPAYLQRQGYRIIPINPNLTEALGEKAYPELNDIPGAVDLVQIFRRPEAVSPFVEQAIQIGAKAIWMQLGIINQPAANMAQKAGLEVVMDRCMMVEHRNFMAEIENS